MADLSKIKFTPVDVEARKKMDFRAGDTVRVWSKIAEEKVSTKANKKTEKTMKFRLQAFEGIVLARKHGQEPGATFTVRKVASGIGVERIFPLYSPLIDKIELVKKSRARRSKLYYIRTKAVRDIRRKMRSVTQAAAVEAETESASEEVKEVVAQTKE
ncbi:50S ribosomal protein L19 [Candidatus Nomurabacteria bacterium RIFCSPLOWO2_01_FULL_46_18]|uniref:Large ribosomal subunit protein bL19 n=1 Tax=Candidatus Nomurabacteria bacterium RIFCSPLOWO2_01_FULL_46_18 TaxID=1801783 RepID=A0A1F6XF19_9BACT|nr:MAG: 50S ribosomal protein L19 [Candidatus Nomurabacteria bacterium RIFCSPLOWO2_01_FULL_46_18]